MDSAQNPTDIAKNCLNRCAEKEKICGKRAAINNENKENLQSNPIHFEKLKIDNNKKQYDKRLNENM